MTNLQYLRMKIPDEDTNNQIFTDEELNQILIDNSEVKLVYAERKDYEGYLYQIPYRHVDEVYTEKVFVDGVNTDCNFNKETGEITFTTPVDGIVAVEVKVVNWGDALADCYEMIMGDYRKLSSYTVSGTSQHMDDLKAHLRMLVRHYRGIKGTDL